MAKNDKLLKVLNGNFPVKSLGEINGALDALIKADPSDASEFRNALKNHEVFWTSLDPSLAPIEDKDDYLLSGGEGAHRLENNFIALRQKAAHQRVLRGLQSAELEVLNEIAKEDDKQKIRDFIKGAHPSLWQDGWGHLTADQLTDDSVTAIRAEAKEKLKQALMGEIKAANDLKNLNDGYKDLDDYDSGDVPKDWIAESDKAELQAAIKARALAVAKQKLVSVEDQAKLAALLKAADFAKFIDKIKEIDEIGEHVDWITEDNIESLKDSARAALASQISKNIEDIDDVKHLKALVDAAKPENVSSYQKKLAPIPALSDAALLNEKNFAAVLPAIRKKAFELQVEQSSPYGKAAHQELIQAFNGASADKQAAIVRELEKNVLRLLHATDENDVKRMLGGDGSTVAAENRRLEKFKRIENAEAAKLLANLFAEKVKPPVELSDQAIDAFNGRFSANDGSEYSNKSANGGEYCQLIQDVFTAITAHLPDSIEGKDFYNKFGLSDDGSGVSAPNIQNGVIDQRNFNLALIVDANNPAHASFMTKFMSVKKAASLDSANASTLWQHFDKSKSFQEFKTKVNAEASLRDKLDANWPQQFTAADFMKLKAEGIKELKTTKEIRNHINAQLEALWKSFPGTKFMGGTHERVLKSLAESDVETWFDPAFMERSKRHAEIMKPKFEALARDCDVIIREMTQHKESIESLKRNLPPTSDPDFPAKDRNFIELHLEEKIKEIRKVINVYEEARDKLMDEVLPSMEEAIKGGQVVQGFRANTGVKVTMAKRGDKDYEEMDRVSGFDFTESERSSLSSGDSGKASWAADKMKSDDVRFFNVTSKGETTNFGARFKEERGGASKRAAVYANDKGQQSAIKLTVVHSPLSNRKNPPSAESEAAKVNFAMVMASQMLAELDGPPDKKHPIVIRGSNEEELKYLWTALKVLQEELKDTKMKFKDDAIQVKSLYFRPETQKGRVFWDSDSLYKTVFQKEANVAIWKGRADDLRELIKDKYAHDRQKASAMGVSSRLFKGEYKELTKARKEQEEELRAGPGLSSS